MAFHPFHFFRKRQKTMLALLTILSMVIFILTGFTGSIVDRVNYWFGGPRGNDKTPVTTLYGKTVTVADIEQVRRNRQVADAFIMGAMATADMSYTPDADVIQHLQSLLRDPFGEMRAKRASLRRYEQELLKQGKTDAARFVAHFGRDLALNGMPVFNQMRLGGWRQSHPGQLYFGGTLSADDLLDFKLWLQQADKLKITLTDDAVRKLVNQETDSEALTGNAVKDAEKMRSVLRGVGRNFTEKELIDALRDEFRVRLAQEALTGGSPGARAALGTGLASSDLPAGATPEQFWEFYKDKQTKLDVGFVKVPVSKFIDQVKDQPTDEELHKLFARYKNDEPSPEREKPAFKVPRRVKVEWVSANPDDPYYQKKAAEVLRNLEFARPFMAAPGPGDTLLTAATRLVPAMTPDLAVQAEYAAYVKGTKSWWDASTLDMDRDSPYATGLRRPDTAAAVLGQLLGSAATGATQWTTPVTLLGATDVRLAQQRARAVSIALAGSSPFVPGVIARTAALVTVPVQPLAVVRDVMAERAHAHLGPQLADGALETFTKDLKAKRFEAKEAAEFVKKNATAEHGITAHGIMDEARGATEIAGDPALAPLRGARQQQLAMTPKDSKDFADALFKPNQPYEPEPYHTVSGAPYYFWLAENDKAYVPTFEEAKPKVLAAWKFAKARELAHKAAEDIVASVKTRPQGTSAERFLQDEAARLGYEYFSAFPPISKLERVEQAQIMATAGTEYRPYRFDDTKFPYPRAGAVDKLFQDLKKPDDGTVLKDRPDRTDYAAVLLKEPAVPSEKDFYDVYQRAPRGLLPDALWSDFQRQRDQQYRAELARQFRTEAQAPLDEDGTYKLDPEVRKRLTQETRADTDE
jgi:hypothetical protein